MTDVISRQQAIKEAESWVGMNWYEQHLQRDVVEWLKELPSAQLGTNLAEVGTDCISRQAAIDIERNATVDTNPSHFEAHQKFTQFMDDAEISSFGRWQWSNGFNTALTAVGIDLKKLPSAQPEIIHCMDCDWWTKQEDSLQGRCALLQMYPTGEWFCGNARRREVTE